MEYKDIKTADELESWYAEKEDILEGYVRDYAVPFGNVYHLDSPGYVSEERWCDTLPSDRERSTFMALQNGVSTKESRHLQGLLSEQPKQQPEVEQGEKVLFFYF